MDTLSIKVAAVRRVDDGWEGVDMGPDQADAFAVYIRNPLAFHVQDFEIDPDRTGPTLRGRIARAGARRRAFSYADALAEHLGCSVTSHLFRPGALVIQPERDLFRSEDGDDTCFAPCDEAEAEHWAVYLTEGREEGDSALIEDFPSRPAAEAFIDRDGRDPRTGALPEAVHWARRTPQPA